MPDARAVRLDSRWDDNLISVRHSLTYRLPAAGCGHQFRTSHRAEDSVDDLPSQTPLGGQHDQVAEVMNVDETHLGRIEPSGVRRYAEAIAFVVLWIASGYGLRGTGLSVEDATYAYLLIGIPLVILFQRLIRRRPLVALWQRDAVRFRLGPGGIVAALCLAAVPALGLFATHFHEPSWAIELYFIAAMVGACGIVFCLKSTSRAALRKGLPAFLSATLVGVAWMVLAALARGRSLAIGPSQGGLFLEQFLVLWPVCFVMEEVAFRGLLDEHLRPEGLTEYGRATRRRREWISACAVSSLWGLWHLPVVPLDSWDALLVAVPALCAVHATIGIPLSFCWRASGSLLLPAASHALIDAYRNAIGLMG